MRRHSNYFVTTALIVITSLFSHVCLAQREPGITKNKVGRKKYLQPLNALEDKSFELKTLKLTGGIKHSESLPPVKSKLSVGATYEEKNEEKLHPSKQWYKLPSWLAGTWESESQTFTSIEDYSSKKIKPGHAVKNHGVVHYGCLKDANGAAWDYVCVPAEVQNESEKTINKDLSTAQSIMYNNEQLLVVKDVFTRRKINKDDKKIIALTQMEEINTLLPVSKDNVQLWASLKTFDLKGKKLSLVNATVSYRRTAPFKQQTLDKNTHEDLRPSFISYLKEHGLEKLIPKK